MSEGAIVSSDYGSLPAVFTPLPGPLRDPPPGERAPSVAWNAASLEASAEPLAFRVALGDAARDAILVSEMASATRNDREVPSAFVLPSLARTSCVVQVNDRQLVLEYGIYRLRG